METSPEHEIWVKTKTSDILLDLADLPGGEKVAVGDMLRYLRGRAFGMFMIVMAILSLIPNLFGHAILTGGLLFILGLQMALGFSHVRLPKRILKMAFARNSIRKVMKATTPKIGRLEKLLRPRMIYMTEDLGRRIIGLIIMPMSLLIMIPLPFTNFWPAISILVLVLGLIEKDGLVVLIGQGLSLSVVWILKELLEKFFN